MEARSIGKKTLKVAGVACAATGIMAASALVASGAAVGAVMEGFMAARKAVSDILKKEIKGNEQETGEAEVVAEAEAAQEVEEQPEVQDSAESAE